MNKFALTFDDGPGPSTADLLDVLQKHGVCATLFIIGRNVEQPFWCKDKFQARSLLIRALREGHVLGNHTYSHVYSTGKKLIQDIHKCDVLIQHLYREVGVKAKLPIPFRLPYGIRPLKFKMSTEEVMMVDPRLDQLSRVGRKHVGWTAEFDDWHSRLQRSRNLFDELMTHMTYMSQMRKTSIIVLHDGSADFDKGTNYARRKATVKAVDLFLNRASKKDWKGTACSIESNRVKWR